MKYVSKIPESVLQHYQQAVPPWGPLGYVTYKRTYSRLRTDLGHKEEWVDTVTRCIGALLDYGMQCTEEEVSDLFQAWFNFQGTTGGRGLWQLGSQTVADNGGDSLMNCWGVNVDSLESFCFTFDQLMLGGGVGFSVLPTAVHKLPQVIRSVKVSRTDSRDVDFIVPDNRQGWVELLRRVLRAFFITGKDLAYATFCIRSKGAPIAGFGGIASGPEELVRGIENICRILCARAGKHLRPIDALDIMDIIGGIVVAGNVRRSALIGIGHATDEEFLHAKDWSRDKIPNWRKMSNNTCCCNDTKKLPAEFWAGYEGHGEPYGLFNLELARKMGRLIDGVGYRPDPTISILNPCGELNLNPYECCCLTDLFLPNLKDLQTFHKTAALFYKVCKTMISLPFAWPQTQAVIEKNRRIGIGATGFAASPFGPEDYSEVYKHLEELDKEYSRILNINPSIKLTTCKPSGTVSLLPGVPPGLHPAYAAYYNRRIRFAAGDPLVDVARAHGYNVEPSIEFDGSLNRDTLVVEFPVQTPPGTRLADDMTAIDQLEFQKMVQTYWSDNATSMTCYYRPAELEEIKAWLRINYKNSVKSGSFLLHTEHGFKQAPYEAITKEQYGEMSARCRPITSSNEEDDQELPDLVECAGACPVR